MERCESLTTSGQTNQKLLVAMEGGGISTLVLIDDHELELRVSSGLVSFSAWATKSSADLTAQIMVSLVSRDSAADDTRPAHLPVIITPPSTTRFQLTIATNDQAGNSSTGTLMPLMHADRSVDYVVEFVPPSTAESDFAWDNFQDQIVVHYKLGKLVVVLNATKLPCNGDTSDNTGGECAFHPRSLPAIRAPALKLFDYVERTNAARPQTSVAGTAALHRNEIRVPGSFNGARRTPTQTLEPLPPIMSPGSRPSSRDIDRSGRRAATPNQPPPVQTEKVISRVALQPADGSTEISSLKEARAVISQLRAQHLTCHRGRMNGAAPSSARSTMTTSTRAADENSIDETSPEAHLETAKRELDAFNSVVAAAKQRVASETAAAKSELCYYKQLLPKATVSKPATPPLGVMLAPLGSSSSSLSTVVDMSKSNQPKPQRATKKRAAGKLPSLGSDSSSTTSKVDNNQELSPKKTGSPTQRFTSMEKTSTERKRTPPTARRPPEVPPQLKPQQQRGQQTTKVTAAPSKASSSSRISVRSLSAVKKAPGPQSKGRERESVARRQQVEDEADSLSDFDDADPEIDAAPDLPEELTGVASLENDSDMDNDGF